MHAESQLPASSVPARAGPSALGLSFSDAVQRYLHAAVGLVLAAYALRDFFIDVPQDVRSPAAAAVVLVFCAYALLLPWYAAQEIRWPGAAWLNWLDCAWYLMLFASSVGTGSVYAYFLVFPALFVALERGVAAGLAVALVSAAGTFAIGVADAGWRTATAFPLWVTPVSLLILAGFVAWLAGALADTRRHAFLLAELGPLSNPRMSLTSLVLETLERLCRILPADGGVLVTTEPGRPSLFRFTRAEGRTTVLPLESATALVGQLLALPETEAVACSESRAPWSHGRFHCLAPPGGPASVARTTAQAAATIANLFECSSMISVPLYYRGQAAGRLFLTATLRRFRVRDLQLLQQIAEPISSLIENVALVERLAGEAAEHERRRLSRDLHDRTIQPYIGIKFGIEALARKLPPDSPLAADVQNLLQMTSAELSGLRNVVRGLRNTNGQEGGALLATIRQQAARFSELFGLLVEVHAEGELPDMKTLQGEIFNMVSEGLNNVWRHTRARSAFIRLGRDAGWLTLRIGNEHGSEGAPRRFVPASIAERAATLGGFAQVQLTGDGCTVIDIRIPLATSGEADHGNGDIRLDTSIPC